MKELEKIELQQIEGGFWQFVAGAIVGGIIYDAVKTAYISAVEGYLEASKDGTYSGMPPSQRFGR